MLWMQGLTSFVLWIAYGAVLVRRTRTRPTPPSSRPRTLRAILGAAALLASAALLMGGLFWASSLPAADGRLTPSAWLVVTFCGLIFVHLQTWAFATVLSVVQEDVARSGSHADRPKEL